MQETTAYTTGPLNQYTAIERGEEAAFEPVHDADGNQTLIRTSTGIWQVAYNAENRPVRFVNESANTVVECTYDYMGRRHTRKVSVNGTVSSYLRYMYRGYLQIAAIDAVSGVFRWFLFWDPTQPEATRPLAIRKDGTWYAYGWDLTGNVTEIFGKAGYLRTVYTYTPYGEVAAEGDVTQPIQWSSEYSDEELGLVYYNYRHLNPHDGRWISRDPIKEEGGWNLFAFAGNSPFLLVDALGLWKKEAGSETIWSAEKNDTLESLAVNEGRNKGDYVCIWPTEGTRDHGYPRKIKPCDKYDVSNLRLPEQENSVELLVADDLFDSYKDIFPGIRKDIEGKNVAKFLQKISQEGKKPITSFILAGHGGRSSKDGNAFTINSLSRLEKKPSFSRAQQKKGPVRCWFSVVATVMFSGCSSSSFAKQFAREFMRKGTTVAGTNQPIGTFVHPVEGPQIVYGYSNDPKTQDLKEDDYYSSKVWEIFNGNL